MKTAIPAIALALTALSCLASAQNTKAATAVVGGSSTTQGVPAPTAYQVVMEDGNSRLWSRMVYEKLPSGQLVGHEQSFTELNAGVNFWNGSAWSTSKSEIDIRSDGSAAATQGSHKAFFPPDIYAGVVQMVLPSGQTLQSQPCALAYDDGENTVIIGVLTNSVGQILNTNEVIYRDAFSGVNADIIFRDRLSGCEQDIVLRDRNLPAPENLGLIAARTKLQILTEFINCPEPSEQSQTDPNDEDMTDTTLRFDDTIFGHGRAFLIGNQSDAVNPIRVAKKWIQTQGRTFLVESVPYRRVANQLQTLPASGSAGRSDRFKLYALHGVSGHYQLPPAPIAANTSPKAKFSRAASDTEDGLVLDYVTINAAQTNYTFKGDMTYYVAGSYNLEGTTVFEGGTVIKMNSSGQLNILADGSVVCAGTAYNPSVFTSYLDGTIGQSVGSGTPAMTNVTTFLYIDVTNVVLNNLRFSYAIRAINHNWGATGGLLDLWNCQFKTVDTAAYGYNVGLHNVLVGRSGANDAAMFVEGTSLLGENVTADGGYAFIEADFPATTTVALTNSIISGQPALYPGDATMTPMTNETVFIPSPSSPIYQIVGAGSYYLTNGSPYRGTGATNISPALSTELAVRTTYPPIVYSNVTFSAATNFNPQALRDGNGTLDLGYHYDPLDYVFGGVTANSNMTFSTGTAVGWFQLPGSGGGGYGISLMNGVAATLNGIVTAPCYSVRYDSVQEGGDGYWNDMGSLANFIGGGSSAATLNATFTRFYHQSGDPGHFRDYNTFLNVNANHCELYRDFGGYGMLLCMTNCLFDRVNFWQGASSASAPIIFRDITWHGGSLGFTHWESGAPYWYSSVRNCAFDGTPISVDDPFGTNSAYADYNYNAFITGVGQFPAEGANNVTVTNFGWEGSWLGNYYLPANSPLIDAGSPTAVQLGLFHFTTQTNQVKDANSVVDIGYHYVATDAYGNPLDSNGNGIPDYIEDTNGLGIFGPSITLVSPVNGSYYADPGNIYMQAAVSDWSGAVTNVQFLQNSNNIASVTNAPYQWSWPIVPHGAYPLTAVARDWNGLMSTSAVVNVTVTNLCGAY